MRISIITVLALSGAAVGVAVAGGVAYATDDAGRRAVVQIVTEREPAGSGGAVPQWSPEDCPDKGGAASTVPAPAGSGTPAAPREAL
ncbi:hypothetical protein [Micromonospora sp. NPDC126480]|uniref:hypothetical protein n=1 Tax=Micromonospora sp. NPDC126480 TaxID=3155312 RepID=UPI003333509B